MKGLMRCKSWLISLAGAVMFTLLTPQPAAAGETQVEGPWRDVFADENWTPSAYVSESPDCGEVYYRLYVRRHRQVWEVDTEYTFHSGDQVRLKIRAERSGYLYLANLGSSGHLNVLSSQALRVESGSWYWVPRSTWLRFDDQPGCETLYLVLSRRPLAGVEETISEGGPGVTVETVALDHD